MPFADSPLTATEQLHGRAIQTADTILQAMQRPDTGENSASIDRLLAHLECLRREMRNT